MKPALKFGLLIGIAYSGLSLMMFYFGLDSSPFFRNLNSLSIIFLSLGIYLGIKNKRSISYDGYIKYSDAFITGIMIAFMAGIIAGCFSYLYIKQINPGYGELVIHQKAQLMIKIGISEEKILKHSNWLRMEYSPKGQFVFNFGWFLILGIIFSFIFSFFISEKKSDGDFGKAEV